MEHPPARWVGGREGTVRLTPSQVSLLPGKISPRFTFCTTRLSILDLVVALYSTVSTSSTKELYGNDYYWKLKALCRTLTFIFLLLRFSTSALMFTTSPGTYPALLLVITADIGPDLQHRQHSFLWSRLWPKIRNWLARCHFWLRQEP